jgi:hypothetical protein
VGGGEASVTGTDLPATVMVVFLADAVLAVAL